MFRAFKAFISKGNIVDLAVAVVMGTAFAAVVSAFTSSLLMPIIGIVGTQPNFDDYTLTLRQSEIRFGSFLTAVATFLITAFSLFLFVRLLDRAKGFRARPVDDEQHEITEVELLTEIRDLLLVQRSRPDQSTSD